jgi:hypothetical protein
MAKTVDQFSTIEDFRQKYNELAIDVGDKSGLRTTSSATVIDALNSLEDKSFFFQEFVYVATAGQTVFSGDDSFGNSLEFRSNRIQVFKNAEHLVEGDDFTISGAIGNTHTIITLTSSATVSDKLVIYSFTGSYLGTSIGAGSGVAGQFTETAANTIYNINSNGVILNGDGSPNQTTSLQSGFNIQLAGKTYSEDNIQVASGKTVTADTFIGNLTGNADTVTNGVYTTDTGSVTNTMLAGSIANSKLSNNSITIGDSVIALGGTDTTITGLTSVTSTNFVGNLTGNVTGNSATVSSINTHAISDLSDVSVTSPSTGQVLSWDGSNFTNSNPAATFSAQDARNAISGGDGLAFNSGTGVMDANTSNGITTSSDNIVLDYETVSVAPSSVGSTSTGHLWFVI